MFSFILFYFWWEIFFKKISKFLNNIAGRNKWKRKEKCIFRIRVISNGEESLPFHNSPPRFLTDPSKPWCYIRSFVYDPAFDRLGTQEYQHPVTHQEGSPMFISLSVYFALAIMAICSWLHRIRTGMNLKRLLDKKRKKVSFSVDYWERSLKTGPSANHSHGTERFQFGTHLHNFLSNFVINLSNISLQIPDHLAKN